MPRYDVPLYTVVWTTVTVEADNPEDALNDAINHLPSHDLMFLDHTYPDVSEWEPATVECHIAAESLEDAVTRVEA